MKDFGGKTKTIFLIPTETLDLVVDTKELTKTCQTCRELVPVSELWDHLQTHKYAYYNFALFIPSLLITYSIFIRKEEEELDIDNPGPSNRVNEPKYIALLLF